MLIFHEQLEIALQHNIIVRLKLYKRREGNFRIANKLSKNPIWVFSVSYVVYYWCQMCLHHESSSINKPINTFYTIRHRMLFHVIYLLSVAPLNLYNTCKNISLELTTKHANFFFVSNSPSIWKQKRQNLI